MTSTPILEEIEQPRPAISGSRTPLVLSAITGFSGLLAAQAIEKYLRFLVGSTAWVSVAILLAAFLGLALGAVTAAGLIRQQRVKRPVLAFGLVQAAVGLFCAGFSYAAQPVLEALASLEIRVLCACLLVTPLTVLWGAAFPLLALTLDNGQFTRHKRWTQAYALNLAGALAASLAGPVFILPALGLRGALWLCFAIGAAVCATTVFLPDPPAEPNPDAATPPKDFHLLLSAGFACGAILAALAVIWAHLTGVVIGGGAYASGWMQASVLLGLLLGAALINRGVQTGRLVRSSLLFQCAALLLLVQFALWDRAPDFFTLTPPAVFQSSFYFAETFKFYVAVLMLAPTATVLGMIYPRLLASPQLRGDSNAWLAGHLSAAHWLGCLSGALLGLCVLVPLAGSEISLKTIILLLGLTWFLFLRREALSRRRLLRVSLVAAGLIALTLGRWWNWGSLTAGPANSFGQAAAHAGPNPSGLRFLPPSFVFRHEDVPGGVTTVVEQTVVDGEVARTVRSLFTNGRLQGDDNPPAVEGTVATGFVPDYGRALLIGLGTGRAATALKHLGFREIAVAEASPGIVQAARECFAGFNEGVLDDAHLKLYPQDGRTVLLSDPGIRYDLIDISTPSLAFAESANFNSREFYQLAHSRLTHAGILQQRVQLHHISPQEIASLLATARSVFRYVGLWYYGGQGLLLAADQPFTGKDAPLLDPEAVQRLIRDQNPPVNTDHHNWLEYATPHYQSNRDAWLANNLQK